MAALSDRYLAFIRATDADSHPIRRTVAGAAISAAMFLLAVVLDVVGIGETVSPLVLFAGPVLTGVYLRSWLALPAAWLGIAVTGCITELVAFVWLGSSEWAQRNAEHWSGDDPAWRNLIGQLLEYVLFGVLFALVAGVVALLARWLIDGIVKLRHRRDERPVGV